MAEQTLLGQEVVYQVTHRGEYPEVSGDNEKMDLLAIKQSAAPDIFTRLPI